MNARQLVAIAFHAYCIAGLEVAYAQTDGTPALNRLRGVVVSKADGAPLPGVAVVMAHAKRGYLYVESDGLGGAGDEREPQRAVAVRNSKLFVDGYTRPDGTFTLVGFAAPNEAWNVAAGDAKHGVALLTDIVPETARESPLRIEVDRPAFLLVTRNAVPRGGSKEAYAGVALACPPTAGGAALAGGNPTQDDANGVRVFFRFWDRASEGDGGVRQIGPLAPGLQYEVAWSENIRRLSYDPTWFSRTVSVRAGESLRVEPVSDAAGVVSGRLTDTKGAALADVNVLVRTDSGLVLGALSDADGHYEIGGVPAGAHRLELLRHAVKTAPT